MPPIPSTASPITCHVLDTTTGTPARLLGATLTLLEPHGPSLPFKATTDNDGRIKAWTNDPGPAISDVFKNAAEHGKRMIWTLTLQTGAYFGEGKTFFPEVEVKFYVEGGQHYHVPVLLGPWSYTTYRGS